MSDKAEKLAPILDAVEKAGGVKLSAAKELDWAERRRVSFSIWAFLFTIIYYIYHGMWKKGLVLLAVSIALQVIVALIPPLVGFAPFVASIIYATRAPVNLYSKYRLGDDSWNPLK